MRAEQYLKQVKRKVEAERIAGISVEELGGAWFVHDHGAHLAGPFTTSAAAWGWLASAAAWGWLDRKGLA
jgi:hypothetical protein